VKADDGVLSGTAKNIAQKELTGVYAAEIAWVKSIENNLVVSDAPAPATRGEKIDDASITSQVKFALLGNKATSALRTKVTTVKGVVVITGEAATEAEKSLAAKLASDVRGVVSVDHRMTVRG
jgi:osmotically-inducible protein OsmY